MTTTSSRTGIRIRAIWPRDEAKLARFYADLSLDSREARFLGATPELTGRAAHAFCGVHHRHGQGFVAEATGTDGRPRIVGHVCLEPVGPHDVEVAIAVADQWQRHGLGRALLAAAIAWGRDRGIERLVASMRWSNGPMLGLLRSMEYPVRFGPADAGVVDVIVDLAEGLPSAA
jgi:acetyltransferase